MDYHAKNHAIVELVRNQVGAINNLLVRSGCPMMFTLKMLDDQNSNWA